MLRLPLTKTCVQDGIFIFPSLLPNFIIADNCGGSHYNIGHYDPQASNFGPMKNNFVGGGGGGGGGSRNFGKMNVVATIMCRPRFFGGLNSES